MKSYALLGIAITALLAGYVAEAQLGRPAKIQPRIRAADWRPLQLPKQTFRWDKNSGTMLELTYVPQSKGIGYKWVAVGEDPAHQPEAGTYEITQGNSVDSLAVRVNTATGQTWLMYGVSGKGCYWTAVSDN